MLMCPVEDDTVHRMKFTSGRTVLTLASFVGLLSLSGCGDPCLDDGRGKGQCFAQSGSETTAGQTETAESADADISAEGQEQEAGDGCENMTQDNGETDVDCGGPCVDEANDMGQCENGQGCLVDLDCISDNCEAGTCAPPDEPEECTNGMQGGSETDVDCGGECVEDPTDPENPDGKCGNGDGCLIDGDCVSFFCNMGTCEDPPDACFNMMADPGETDIDCGGDCVADAGDPDNPEGKCDNGELCEVDGDCVSFFCDMGQCGDPPEACFNMMADPGETDVDCGGDCVEDPNDPNNENGKCLPGEACLIDSDCTTELCVNGICEEDPCADMMQNNDETDVDCGQSCVADPNDPMNLEGKCDNGEGCLVDSDCTSNACDPNSLLCVDVCMNLEEDVAETDVDCGGACVVDPNDPNNPDGKCDEGEGCLIDSDCVSNVCDPDNFVCLGLCENMQVDPGESDVDCGGNCVEVNPDNMNDIDGQCGPGDACLDDVDCVAGNCINDACDVCSPVDGYSTCALCLVGGCCDAVTACLLDIPKCVCWFNCISEPGSSVQACMDECGNGNIGMIQSCISNTCGQECD
jgi:hypothetical protein